MRPVQVSDLLIPQEVLEWSQRRAHGSGGSGGGRFAGGCGRGGEGAGILSVGDFEDGIRGFTRDVAGKFLGQISQSDQMRLGERAGAFDDVLEFADIAGPIVSAEGFDGLARDLEGTSQARVDLVAKEMRDQQ